MKTKLTQERTTKLVKQEFGNYVTPFLENFLGPIKINIDGPPFKAQNAKRKRGRSGKASIDFDPLYIPFKQIPPVVRNQENVASVSAGLRGLLANYPNLPDKEGSLAAWINAMADSVDRGDALHAGYYAFHAIRHAILSAHFETLDAGDGTKATLVGLAYEGHRARKANKRRGKSVSLKASLRA